MTARFLRLLVSVAALAAIAAPPASAAEPLTGTGENIQPIAKVPMEHPNEVELAGDWAFVSNDFYGMTIVNISDPANPFVEGVWECEAGWGDIDINPQATLAFLTNAHGSECLDEPTWVAIVDITDKKNPRLVGTIGTDEEIEYVHTSTLDNDLIYLNPQAAAFYPQGNGEPRITVWDVSDPANPVKKASVAKPGIGLAHDTYIDHRPDGKSLLYSGSIHTSDVFDVTDPFDAELLQETFSPEISISHDVQPNHDRTLIVVDDEGAAGGQLDEAVSVCGRFGGPGPGAVDSGSIHFYEAAEDGTFANQGLVELGSWNAPANANEGACVAHVFWQAPDENRLTQAYYRMGAFVLDFEDPSAPEMLGSFEADGGSNYWSVKPHRGYMFATSQDHDALDILKYTGEGGSRWPATAGPAEIQRSARQGVPYTPLDPKVSEPLPAPPADDRKIGRVRVTARLSRIPGRRGRRVPVKIAITDSAGERVASLTVRRKAGKRSRVRIKGGAVAGRYSYVAKAGRRKVGRGRFTVKPREGMKLSPGAKMAVRAR